MTIAANITILIVIDFRIFTGQFYKTMHSETNDTISKYLMVAIRQITSKSIYHSSIFTLTLFKCGMDALLKIGSGKKCLLNSADIRIELRSYKKHIDANSVKEPCKNLPP